MDGNVVPGRNHFFGFVPAGRDIGVGSPEHRHGLGLAVEVPPLGIGLGHVPQQPVRPIAIGIQKQRDMAGRGNAFRRRHQQREALLTHETMEHRRVIDVEMPGPVHLSVLHCRDGA